MENKRFKRSDDRYLGGVLGGLAEYFGWNALIVRIVYSFVTVISFGFPGLILYIILWAIMESPDE